MLNVYVRFYVGLGSMFESVYFNTMNGFHEETPEAKAMAITLASFDGATIYRHYGGWRNADGKPEFERGIVVEVLTDEAGALKRFSVIEHLARAFKQKSILTTVTQAVQSEFSDSLNQGVLVT